MWLQQVWPCGSPGEHHADVNVPTWKLNVKDVKQHFWHYTQTRGHLFNQIYCCVAQQSVRCFTLISSSPWSRSWAGLFLRCCLLVDFFSFLTKFCSLQFYWGRAGTFCSLFTACIAVLCAHTPLRQGGNTPHWHLDSNAVCGIPPSLPNTCSEGERGRDRGRESGR